MAARLVHRGPDGEGYWVDGSIGFGHRRLSIIDVAGSPQPMAAVDDRLHVTFNGEIFNYRELRRRLRLPVPHQRRHRGAARPAPARRRRRRRAAAGPVRLRDLRRRRRPLAVPRPARRPAAVHLQRRSCSPSPPRSRRCSRRCRRRPTVDLASLDSLPVAARPWPAPHTLFERRQKLLPGHRHAGRAGPGRSSPSPTGRCRRGAPRRRVRRRGRAAGRRTALEDAVAPRAGGRRAGRRAAQRRRRQQPHRGAVPRSCAAASRRDLLGRLRRPPLRRAALRPRGQQGRSAPTTTRSSSSRTTSCDCGARSPGTATRRSPSRPTSPCSSWPSWLASRSRCCSRARAATSCSPATRSTGWPRCTAGRRGARRRSARRCSARVEQRAAASGRARPHRAPRAVGAHRGRAAGVVVRAVHARGAAPALLGGAPRAPTAPSPLAARRRRSQRMLAVDCQGWLADNLLERGDRMAMAASVELRPPFLDHRLVELAFSLPSRVKVRRGQTKWVLKEVARRHLPGRDRRPAQGRASGCRSTTGSGATSATWPTTPARPGLVRRPSVMRPRGRCARSLDAHDVGPARRVDPDLDAPLARDLARRVHPVAAAAGRRRLD